MQSGQNYDGIWQFRRLWAFQPSIGDIPAYTFILDDDSWLVMITDGISEAFGVEITEQLKILDHLPKMQELPACAHDVFWRYLNPEDESECFRGFAFVAI